MARYDSGPAYEACVMTLMYGLGVYKGGVGRHLVVNMLKDPELLQNALMV